MSNAARRIEPLVDPYVDGELPPEKMVEVEQLMLDSEECREQVLLSQAIKESMRQALTDEEPSASFEARLRGALRAEREREEALEEHGHGRVLPWKYILPIAAAAGFTLVLGASGDHPQSRPSSSAEANVMPNTQPTPITVDALVDELVSHHAAPPPEPEVVEPRLVETFEPQVGVPVHVPQGLHDYGAQWLGGSVIPVRNQKAASFRYRLAGHRVTVYIYDSKRVPVRNVFEPKVVRNMAVYMGSRRGYTIAAVERRGVGYAVATDLDEPESAELVVASMR